MHAEAKNEQERPEEDAFYQDREDKTFQIREEPSSHRQERQTQKAFGKSRICIKRRREGYQEVIAVRRVKLGRKARRT
jgi:hypothetical protein